jgi:Rrf2 family protein
MILPQKGVLTVLSSTAEYALRAVLFLAQHPERCPIRAGELAAALRVPPNYLAKILHHLVTLGVLRSSRGRNGGFELAVSPGRLTLLRVVEGFDRIRERQRCLLGRKECSDHNACAAHRRWKVLADEIARFFRQTTVKDLLAHGV